MPDLNVWVVKWTRMGLSHFVDFGERDDAFVFAQRVEESTDRENVMVLQYDAPEIDAKTQALIQGRVKDRLRNEKLLASLKDRVGE